MTGRRSIGVEIPDGIGTVDRWIFSDLETGDDFVFFVLPLVIGIYSLYLSFIVSVRRREEQLFIFFEETASPPDFAGRLVVMII